MSTQPQALNALIFLYKQVLHYEINDKIVPIKARRRRRLPVVMSIEQTRIVLDQMHGQHLLMAELLYGAGLRLMECVRLRINSIDMDRGMIYVRFGKGGKDRAVPLPSHPIHIWRPSPSRPTRTRLPAVLWSVFIQ